MPGKYIVYMTVKRVTPTDIRAVMAEFGRRGGAARAQVLTPARRKEIAVRAATIRWYKRKQGEKL